MRRIVLPVLLMIFVVGFGFASGEAEQAEGEEEAVELRLGHVQAPSSPYGRATQRFAELVEEYTDGTVTVSIFPRGELGSNPEVLNSLRAGSLPMALVPYPLLADFVPEYTTYTAGYFYDDWEELKTIMTHEDYGVAWNQRLLEEGGIRVIGNVYYGARNLTTSDDPVYEPADLKGRKIRAVTNPMSLAVVRGLGGQPTPIAFPELYQNLRQGVADGQENPLPTIWAQKFYEVQTYLMLTRHQHLPLPRLMNEDAWESLSGSQQEAILRAGREAGEYGTQETFKELETLVEQLQEEGMEVIDESDGLEVDAFKSSVREEVLNEFAGDPWPEGLAEDILDLVSD